MKMNKTESKIDKRNLILLPVSDWAEWDNGMGGSEQASVFLCSSYLDTCGLAKSARNMILDNKNVGGILIPELFPNLQSSAIRSYSTYQSVWLAKSELKGFRKSQNRIRVLADLGSLLSKSDIELNLSLHWTIEDIRGLDWAFFEDGQKSIQFMPRYTGILDLTSFKDFTAYLVSVASGRKADFKAGEKLSISKHEDHVAIHAFLDMYRETVPFKDSSTRDTALKQVNDIILKSINAGTGTLWLGMDQTGTLLSGVFMQEFAGMLYYQFGASNNQNMKFSANAVLLLRIIEEAFTNGSKAVDFVGMNSPTRGSFKASLNPSPKLYFQVHIK